MRIEKEASDSCNSSKQEGIKLAIQGRKFNYDRVFVKMSEMKYFIFDNYLSEYRGKKFMFRGIRVKYLRSKNGALLDFTFIQREPNLLSTFANLCTAPRVPTSLRARQETRRWTETKSCTEVYTTRRCVYLVLQTPPPVVVGRVHGESVSRSIWDKVRRFRAPPTCRDTERVARTGSARCTFTSPVLPACIRKL